jgi:hypothetical protein
MRVGLDRMISHFPFLILRPDGGNLGRRDDSNLNTSLLTFIPKP